VHILRAIAFLTYLVVSLAATANTTIPPGSALGPGQTVFSQNGRYRLVMQTDGNLVLYRNDNLVRFATYRYGYYSIMQGDGNFVEYTASNQPVWATYTTYSPGAYAVVQDDGNFVIYSSSGVPLWHIGADTTANEVPSNFGDVAARDLSYPGLGALGHVGVWTGANMVEANKDGGENAIRYVSWDSFRRASTQWGIARPNIPHYFVNYCYEYWCDGYNGYQTVTARQAIAARARQIQAVGADYTLSAAYFPAAEGYRGWPPLRGTYRCDTFVIDLFVSATTYTEFSDSSVPQAWRDRMNSLKNMLTITPYTVWTALKN
jgi:hypothetical protein